LFRVLGTPGPRDVTPWAAAALLDRPQAETERLLDRLVATSLLEVTGRDGCAVRRYQLHDLLRHYAQKLLGTEDSEANREHALDRLSRAYYGCVNYAFDRQNQGNPMVDAEYLADWQQVKDPLGKAAVECAGQSPARWFAEERENLVALVDELAKQEPIPAITPWLASSLFYFLEMGGYWKEWQAVDEIGDAVAVRLGDDHARARSLRNLGRRDLVLVLEQQDRLQDDSEDGLGTLRIPAVGDCAAAIDRLEQSRVLYRESRDLGGEATTVRELADAYRLEGRLSEAVEAYKEAAALYRQLPEATRDNATASLRLALGMTYILQGHYDDAESTIRQSLDYASRRDERGRSRHPRLEGYALRRLGDVYRDQERLKEAADAYQGSVEAFRAIPDAKSEARALAELGRTQLRLPRTDDGLDSLSKALAIFEGRSSPEAVVVKKWLEGRQPRG
jgi:tetratricopeptide (TPR) repeat protein